MPIKGQPYQPFLLRLIHGATGISTITAILTAYWTYDTFDGRWGRFLPEIWEIESIHGTFGLYSLLLLPFLVLYSCHRGARRLIQPNAITHPYSLGQPRGRYNLHRLINTLALLALTFAVGSGKMMDETWLPKGELDHAWYYAHLVSWVILVLCIASHALLVARIGGVPFLKSIWLWSHLPMDSPRRWPSQVRHWWMGLVTLKHEWQRLPGRLQLLEGIVLGGVILAWLLPLLKF